MNERLMNKGDKNRHFVLLIIDLSKHGPKEMGHVKMAGSCFVKDGYSMMTRFCKKKPEIIKFVALLVSKEFASKVRIERLNC